MRDLNQEELGHVYGAGNYCNNKHKTKKNKCDRGSKRTKISRCSKNTKNTKYCA